MVAEYIAYELVEDSNDEKQLEKAEKAAGGRTAGSEAEEKAYRLMSAKPQKPWFTMVQLPRAAASTQAGPLQCSNLGG